MKCTNQTCTGKGFLPTCEAHMDFAIARKNGVPVGKPIMLLTECLHKGEHKETEGCKIPCDQRHVKGGKSCTCK